MSPTTLNVATTLILSAATAGPTTAVARMIREPQRLATRRLTLAISFLPSCAARAAEGYPTSSQIRAVHAPSRSKARRLQYHNECHGVRFKANPPMTASGHSRHLASLVDPPQCRNHPKS